MVELRHVSLSYPSHEEASEGFASAAADASAAGTASSPAFAEKQLKDINLVIREGECTLLTGPSGCGKTSLLRLINGLIPRYYPGHVEGKILLAGEDIADKELYELAAYAGTVFQNPRSQFFNVDTTGELAFSCENQGMDPREIMRRIESTALHLSLEKLLGRNIFKLSGGEKQQIACGTIDVARPPLILLDEPSANLDFSAMLRLREIIKIWKNEGKTIIIAEHRLAYLWDLPERFIVMHEGEIREDFKNGSHKDLSSAALTEMGLRSKTLTEPDSISLPSLKPGDVPVIFENYAFQYKKSLFTKEDETAGQFSCRHIAFAENKITALTGANGTGKSTFLRCLCGLEKRAKGLLKYHGRYYKNRARKDLCFLVMQESSHQLFTESVLEEVLLSFPPQREMSEDERREEAFSLLAKLDLEGFEDKHPMTLSGGQKQRLAVACALASDREILLFDEPTSGLDYRHMRETAKLLEELRDEGKTIIVATHDAELIQAVCERKINFDSLQEFCS